ncbi:EEF1A lysine methyltransferase 4 [Exaiptasia diaphana]|uniref:EEF1A lysine methyltransferase 4 n=1 Tax=Exaiptasia diaphana TaxID=2652724 RepID=A0A913XI97_EXADI|nr:EEF1A lysine methyltransferase 4 [Exaiptasia diaphana]KXJ26006.1 Endothelin-converting enzyme 2 [Exaiptasia diaphana]
MDLPDKNETYKLKEYWDERYSKEDSFEWCKSYGDFKQLLSENINKGDRILMLGCGNSSLSEDMYRDGYINIVNIDFSPVVIENMRKKCQDMIDMEWRIMDITKMSFTSSSFDVVIEKATLDALLVEEKDSWNPSKEARDCMNCVLSQVSHILKDGGRFISVTFSQPHFRKPFLAKSEYNWSIRMHTFGDSFHFFFYVMEKGKELSKEDKALESTTKNKDNCINKIHDLNGEISEDEEDFLLNMTL